VIDYRAEQFEERVRGVDVVFDTVGGDTLRRSWDVLRPGGRLVTIAASEEGVQDERTRAAFFIVEPRRAELDALGALELDPGGGVVAGLLPPAHGPVHPARRQPPGRRGVEQQVVDP